MNVPDLAAYFFMGCSAWALLIILIVMMRMAADIVFD